ncbi:hypothetical protein AGLY_006033 [Aphis glycines]|uniref:Uncharacterized protein n=1 Tax=Aphis glycines TaxID=307491 RepID=A0A6G0TSK9_APHGL|nr:hypothetical protein AGLY_006033 [Aphis glycines]
MYKTLYNSTIGSKLTALLFFILLKLKWSSKTNTWSSNTFDQYLFHVFVLQKQYLRIVSLFPVANNMIKIWTESDLITQIFEEKFMENIVPNFQNLTQTSSSLISMSSIHCPNFLKDTGNMTPLALVYPFRKVLSKLLLIKSDISLSTFEYVISAMFSAYSLETPIYLLKNENKLIWQTRRRRVRKLSIDRTLNGIPNIIPNIVKIKFTLNKKTTSPTVGSVVHLTTTSLMSFELRLSYSAIIPIRETYTSCRKLHGFPKPTPGRQSNLYLKTELFEE